MENPGRFYKLTLCNLSLICTYKKSFISVTKELDIKNEALKN